MNPMRTRTCLFVLMLSLAAGIAAAQGVLFSDTFLGRNAQRPQMWEFDTPENAFWTIDDGWLTSGDGGNLIAPDKYSFGWVRVPGSDQWNNYRVSCRFWMKKANGSVVLVGRWMSREAHYQARVEAYGDERIAKIVKVFAREEKVLAFVSLDKPEWGLPPIGNGRPEQAIEFSFALRNANLSVALGGNEVLSARDEEMVQGTAGVGERMNEVFFDDFLVVSGADATTGRIGTIYHVELARNISRREAEAIQQSIAQRNLGPVFMHGPDEATFLWLGNYLNKAEAEAALKQLPANTLSDASVVEEKIGSAKSANLFTVELYSGDDAVMARQQSSDLRGAGYAPEVAEDKGTYHVYVGRFETSAEAQRWRLYMYEDNFILAKVVDLGAGGSAAAAAGATGPRREIETSKLAVNVPDDIKARPEWTGMTRKQQEEVLEAFKKQVVSRLESQTAQQLMELTKQVKKLDEGQKNILNTMAQQEQAREEKLKNVNQLVSAINRAITAQNWEDALKLCDKLDEIDPNSPQAAMKRDRIKYMSKGARFEGEDIWTADNQRRIEQLKIDANRFETDGDLDLARQTWQQVLSIAPPGETALAGEARNKIDSLRRQIDTLAAQAEQRRKKDQLLFAAILGGAIVVVLGCMLLAIYVIGRRRYRTLMAQLQSEAITPLQELRDRTQVLASGLGTAGLTFDDANRNLLEQSDLSEADFMIPETPQQTRPSPAPSGGRAPKTGGAASEQIPGLAPFESVPTPPPTKKSAPAPQPRPAPPEDEISADDFAFPSGEPAPRSAPRRSTLPSDLDDTQPASDEIVLSFDNGETAPSPLSIGADEMTGGAITATEVDRSGQRGTDDLVFSFEDTRESPTSQPAAQPIEPPRPSAPSAPSGAIDVLAGLDDSLFSVSGGAQDLSLDLDIRGATTQGLKPPAGGAPGADSLLDGLDLLLDVPATGPTAHDEGPFGALEPHPMPSAQPQPAAPAPKPAPRPAATPSAAGAVISQDFNEEQVGQMPVGWFGDNTDFATLSVVPDPDGTRGNCVQFKKTAGKGATNFSCRFPDAKGRVEIEFDIRCDEKNKHLLGLYIEKDGDFRRSIHTVVQCVDPKRPAHLRVFTRPTPYTLKTWRHVRFVVDVAEGVVDGYVDKEHVASEVRMGMKAPSLNTFSIRDNTETTGLMYLDNLVVRGS